MSDTTHQADASDVDDIDPDRWAMLAGAALKRLMVRYDGVGRRRAIDLLNDAIAAAPDHPQLAGRLSDLGTAYLLRFNRDSELRDLDRAIEIFRRAVQAVPDREPLVAMCLSNLGVALRTRFDRLGERSNLDDAIGALSEAIEVIPRGHLKRAITLTNLGAALRIRLTASMSGMISTRPSTSCVSRTPKRPTPTPGFFRPSR